MAKENRRSDFKIATIHGIDIEINYSWLIIFFLVFLGFSFSFFPVFYPNFPRFLNFVLGFITATFLFLSVLFHELMHSLVAQKQGIQIHRITLFLFGGVSEIKEEPKSPGNELKMALAGPFASLFLSAVFLGVFYLGRDVLPESIEAPFYILGQLNLVLGLFNLAPGFPLDGGRVLRALLWYFNKDYLKSTRISVRAGEFIAYFMIAGGFLSFIFGNAGGLWLAFIGFFLLQSSRLSLSETETRVNLEEIEVESIMNPNPLTIPENMNARIFAEQYFLKSDIHSALVTGRDGKVVGFVDINKMDAVRLKDWEREEIRDLTQKYENSDFIGKKEKALDVLKMMSERDETVLPVVDNGELIGAVSKENVLNYLKVRRA